MRHSLFIILVFVSLYPAAGWTQYPPAAGLPGSTAIHADSNVFVGWANRCYIHRGLIDIQQPELGFVSYGNESDALGKADNQVVSLGDGGSAILSFANPICDKPGFDFAVFENSFDGNFLELAFVEISSDSIHWFRFPAISLTPTTVQVGTFGTIDPTKIHNMAGKYAVMYGTPFDIADIENHENLDKQNIRFVKIIDVVGTINPALATFDAHQNIINDPYPTPFYTGGFDLDAVGVIHSCSDNIQPKSLPLLTLYPNPCNDYLEVYPAENNSKYSIIDISGKMLLQGNNISYINTTELEPGVYFIHIIQLSSKQTLRFIKQ